MIDDDVVDDSNAARLKARRSCGTKGRIIGLGDMRIGGQAGDQNVGLALGVEQVPHVARMHDVERAVAHDDFLLARPRTRSDAAISCGRLDLVTDNVAACGVHHCSITVFLLAMVLNQVVVALAIVSGVPERSVAPIFDLRDDTR